MRDLLTLKELAIKLKVNERTLRRLCHAGKLPFIWVAGVMRFEPDAIDKWIASGGNDGKQ